MTFLKQKLNRDQTACLKKNPKQTKTTKDYFREWEAVKKCLYVCTCFWFHSYKQDKMHKSFSPCWKKRAAPGLIAVVEPTTSAFSTK